MVVLSTLLLPAMIVRFYQGWFQMLFIDLPLFLASSCSISGFYMASQRALYPKTWQPHHPLLALRHGRGHRAFGAQRQSRARSDLRREIRIRAHAEIQHRRPKRHLAKKIYRNRAGWMPWVEIGLGLYFAATIVYAFQNENYATMPFLVLFVWGYLYTGVMSIGQGWFERLRMGVRVREEVQPAPDSAPGF